MRTALAVEEVADVPSSILAMKYFRLKLASGEIAGSKPVGTDSAKHRRRSYLLRIDSTEKRRRRDGRVVDVPVTTYGAVIFSLPREPVKTVAVCLKNSRQWHRDSCRRRSDDALL